MSRQERLEPTTIRIKESEYPLDPVRGELVREFADFLTEAEKTPTRVLVRLYTNAHHGSGATFFLHWLEHAAKESGWQTAYLDFSRTGDNEERIKRSSLSGLRDHPDKPLVIFFDRINSGEAGVEAQNDRYLFLSRWTLGYDLSSKVTTHRKTGPIILVGIDCYPDSRAIVDLGNAISQRSTEKREEEKRRVEQEKTELREHIARHEKEIESLNLRPQTFYDALTGATAFKKDLVYDSKDANENRLKELEENPYSRPDFGFYSERDVSRTFFLPLDAEETRLLLPREFQPLAGEIQAFTGGNPRFMQIVVEELYNLRQRGYQPNKATFRQFFGVFSRAIHDNFFLPRYFPDISPSEARLLELPQKSIAHADANRSIWQNDSLSQLAAILLMADKPIKDAEDLARRMCGKYPMRFDEFNPDTNAGKERKWFWGKFMRQLYQRNGLFGWIESEKSYGVRDPALRKILRIGNPLAVLQTEGEIADYLSAHLGLVLTRDLPTKQANASGVTVETGDFPILEPLQYSPGKVRGTLVKVPVTPEPGMDLDWIGFLFGRNGMPVGTIDSLHPQGPALSLNKLTDPRDQGITTKEQLAKLMENLRIASR